MNLQDLPTVTEFPFQSMLQTVPADGTLVGRIWLPATADQRAGPRVVFLSKGQVFSLENLFPTMAHLLNHEDPVEAISRQKSLPALLDLETLLQNSLFYNRARNLREEKNPVLLAPNDLLTTRACGVTFAKSLLERVVEEKAKGDPSQAREIRALIQDSIGNDISQVQPGSPATEQLKKQLQAQGMWSQYLEVGIGPDAEIFTKTAPMASIGFGAELGILPTSSWNNPEPEIVLAVSHTGKIQGATLGNDVNLRDFEGRSALLLGEAKDQNGSCAIGPWIRLFDETFSLESIKSAEVELTIIGSDGFQTTGVNKMAEISRPPEDLVAQALGEHHQYPDGLMLFLGTMFAPTEDREKEGQGFTHHLGDRVEIATTDLGRLVNWVNHTNAIPRWDYGICDLMEFLQAIPPHKPS